ncbi:exported protein of unknown function [Georgfuchsia toluolica]|uniref:Uncharacterized protein n=1 Tax=Georgfuchsia toluolica TaxID=424218 RepID=A0A916J5D5_9PROT|nr:hypothetical protein [Georgfuchsia toluolica]CAG4884859.1 exported protein of unknown function [Georgfuchsia toluolica]
MKSLFVLFWTLLAALPLHAETPQLVQRQQGYAIDNPRVLVQQRLFGLAHGIALLAATCGREPAYRETLPPVYAEWQERQESTIAASQRDLARYYFRDRALEATRRDIAHALKLKDSLSLKPGSQDLHAACATFVEALGKPRYDLGRQYLMLSLAWRLSEAMATEARVEACRARLPVEETARLDESALLWQQAFDAGIEEAKKTLAQRWDDVQLDGTFDEWMARAREDGKRSAVAERCNTLAQWLLTRKADPDDAFNTEP